MGTSAKNPGPGPASSLIPSWLEPESTPVAPEGLDDSKDPFQSPVTDPLQTDAPSESEHTEEAPPLPLLPAPAPPADSARFKTARTYLNKSARTGTGSGGRELRRAISEYVRRGYGTGRGFSARVSNSTRAAGNILGFAQAIRDRGFETAAKQFGLQGLLGKPIEEAAALLIDAFATPTTTTDDNITRDAWCEVVKQMIADGVQDFATLTPEQWAAAVETFLCKAIELRIFNEIGNDAVGIAPDVAKIDQIENDLEALIRGGVQNTIVPLIQDGQIRSTHELNQYVDQIVDGASDYLQALSDAEDQT